MEVGERWLTPVILAISSYFYSSTSKRLPQVEPSDDAVVSRPAGLLARRSERIEINPVGLVLSEDSNLFGPHR